MPDDRVFLGAWKPSKPVNEMTEEELDEFAEMVLQNIQVALEEQE